MAHVETHAAVAVRVPEKRLGSRAPKAQAERQDLTFMMTQIGLPMFLSISVRGCILDGAASSLIVSVL